MGFELSSEKTNGMFFGRGSTSSGSNLGFTESDVKAVPAWRIVVEFEGGTLGDNTEITSIDEQNIDATAIGFVLRYVLRCRPRSNLISLAAC